jgi:glycosyltransferase involved in cell wall biosynthesis
MISLSVVMPVLNGEKTISRALASVEKQSIPIQQLIVVDDGSSDNTGGLVDSWATRLPVRRLRNERNIGIARSLRCGVEAAVGHWVCRLDADDAWHPDHVERLIRAVEGSPDAVLAASSARMVTESGESIGQLIAPPDSRVRAALMWDNPLVHSAVAYSKAAYEAVGGYAPDQKWEDYDLWIRLLGIGRLASVGTPTIDYTVASHSLSRGKRSQALRARWACQRKAIRAFGTRHPAAALRCAVLGGLRMALPQRG